MAWPWELPCARVPVPAVEGGSDAAIARHLVVSEAAVGRHIGDILTQLDLPPAEETHRRVLAVPAFLRA